MVLVVTFEKNFKIKIILNVEYQVIYGNLGIKDIIPVLAKTKVIKNQGKIIAEIKPQNL